MTHETFTQVAANITCYVHPGSRANAAKPSRLTRHVAECIDAIERAAMQSGADTREAVLRMARDEYDDWIEYGSRAPNFCSDLDSAEVTRLVDEGLILGGIEGEDGENMPAGRSTELEAQEPPEGEGGRREDMGVDGVSDVSQAGKPETHAGGDADPALRLETQSSASTDDVAEAARLLVDGQAGSPEAAHEYPPSGSGDGRPPQEDPTAVAAEGEIITPMSAPSGTTLSAPDMAA